MAQATGQVMWTSCRCRKIVEPTFERPAPTLASLRFEVFSALAYGSQGIIFNTYANTPNNADQKFSNAPVDNNGNKTATWYLVQQVISEIKRYTDVFLGGIPVAIRHTGSMVYPGATPLSGEIGPCLSVNSGNAGVLVSHFANHGDNYLIIVNHDFQNAQPLSLKFASNRIVTELTTVNLDQVANTVVNSDGTRTIARTLQAGGYLIFKWF